MQKRSLKDLPDSELRGKRALVRVDYNVPLDGTEVVDDTRIRATLPTLEYLLERGARVILISHLGRPKGEWHVELSLRPAAERLDELIDAPVTFVDDIAGSTAEEAGDELGGGAALLLEHLGLLPGEEASDTELYSTLATRVDLSITN